MVFVCVCGRSLGSFPVYPLQHPHRENNQRLCSADAQKKESICFSFFSCPVSFFPFSSFRYLSSVVHSFPFYLFIFTFLHCLDSKPCRARHKPEQFGWLSLQLMALSRRTCFSNYQTHSVCIDNDNYFIPIELNVSLIAVVTVDGEQTHTTTVMKKTLNPYWNESFDL